MTQTIIYHLKEVTTNKYSLKIMALKFKEVKKFINEQQRSEYKSRMV